MGRPRITVNNRNYACAPGRPNIRRTKYGLGLFLFDMLLVLVTGGLWLIYMYCREMRRNTGRSYSLLGWIGDILMSAITFGVWLFWVFFRELGRR